MASEPSILAGLPVIVDPKLPPGTIEARYRGNRLDHVAMDSDATVAWLTDYLDQLEATDGE